MGDLIIGCLGVFVVILILLMVSAVFGTMLLGIPSLT